jgi:Flp pilus assembly protein TadG
MTAIAALARRHRSADRGVAGTEFALIASLLAILLVGVVDVGAMVTERRDMTSAVRAGAQYFMVGGADLDEAEAVIVAAWSARRDEVELGIAKACFCAGLTHACTANCADGALPATYHIITATTTFEGVLVETDHVVTETIRIR